MCVTNLFLGAALFFISSFHTTSLIHAGLLGVDCLLIPKGQVGTVDVKYVSKGLGLKGWFSSSLESGRAEKPLWVLWWEMSDGSMSCFWIGGTNGHS